MGFYASLLETFHKMALYNQAPPRPGLVPKSGDPKHPYRWIRPKSYQPNNADLPKNLLSILEKPKEGADSIISILDQNPTFKQLYDKDAMVSEGYTIREHTKMVLGQFTDYVEGASLPNNFDAGLFKLMLALHDIGKPLGGRDKTKQGEFTAKIMGQLEDQLVPRFGKKQFDLFVTIPKGDPLGAFFQKKISLEQTEAIIKTMAKTAGVTSTEGIKAFFDLLVLYYQTDIASYTKDAGGLPSLEFLFQYEMGKKIFDQNQKRFVFSPPLEKMYKRLWGTFNI